MTLYKYVGPNDHYLSGGDTKLEPGDEIELDEDEISFPEFYEEVDPESEEAESAGESESDGSEGESSSGEAEAAESGDESPDEESEVEPPLDPSDYTIDELKAELSARDLSEEEIEAIEDAERDNGSRTGALDVIEQAGE